MWLWSKMIFSCGSGHEFTTTMFARISGMIAQLCVFFVTEEVSTRRRLLKIGARMRPAPEIARPGWKQNIARMCHSLLSGQYDFDILRFSIVRNVKISQMTQVSWFFE